MEVCADLGMSSPARAAGTEDALIAATAEFNAMIVLTANVRPFAPMGVRYADPSAELPPDIG